jgi:hypothetical protein
MGRCSFSVVRAKGLSWRQLRRTKQVNGQLAVLPCGGGVEYLHRDSASRRRRRKGKSQIWDSKIRWRVPRDSDPRKTAQATASSIYKRQTHPLVREGAPQTQDRNCQIVINLWSWAPNGARHQDLLTDRPSVAMWLWLWLWRPKQLAVGSFQVNTRRSEQIEWNIGV